MTSYQLTAEETRILGCLLEKERTTPENYPLSLNALTAACNQSTNRDPVVSYDESTVDAGIYALRQKKLVTAVSVAGSRVQKYRHNFRDHYELEPREAALIGVLLLRGAQTPGELRIRTERLCGASSLEQIEAALTALTEGEFPLVKILPARPGQKERRYIQLLSDPAIDQENVAAAPAVTVLQPPAALWEPEVAALRAELQQLREEFAAFRRQFE